VCQASFRRKGFVGDDGCNLELELVGVLHDRLHDRLHGWAWASAALHRALHHVHLRGNRSRHALHLRGGHHLHRLWLHLEAAIGHLGETVVVCTRGTSGDFGHAGGAGAGALGLLGTADALLMREMAEQASGAVDATTLRVEAASLAGAEGVAGGTDGRELVHVDWHHGAHHALLHLHLVLHTLRVNKNRDARHRLLARGGHHGAVGIDGAGVGEHRNGVPVLSKLRRTSLRGLNVDDVSVRGARHAHVHLRHRHLWECTLLHRLELLLLHWLHVLRLGELLLLLLLLWLLVLVLSKKFASLI